MKKILTVMAMLALCCMMVVVTGCGSSEDTTDVYEQVDLTQYVTLPDYSQYTVDPIEVSVTDDEIEAEIEEKLEAAATTEDVTEGTVDKGDTVTISFDGKLADGTSVDGMSSDSYTLTLGSGSMIDGFEEGIYGAEIGDTLTLDLTFPDPYTNNEDLSGKDVTFEVTVLSKQVSVTPTLDEDFVKENSEATTVEEYKQLVKEELEEDKYTEAENDAKVDIFNDIVDGAEISEIPTELSDYEKNLCETTYRNYCEEQEMEWADFLSDTLGCTEDEFNEQLETYASEMAKYKMIAYVIAGQEDISYTHDEVIDRLLELAGVDSEDDFESYYGTTAEEYAAVYNSYGLKVSMLLESSLNKIYESLSSK